MPHSAFLESTSFTPLFGKLLSKRRLDDPEKIERFISARVDDLLDPFQMKGMKEAVDCIHRVIQARGKILVHGDYDVDGITSTAILARTLSELGARYQTFLPNRTSDGYGVSDRAMMQAAEEGVSLVITADCGISAHEEIKMARSLGMDVIVIDHHRISADGLPEATVILNPLQENCPYPFKELSAGGLSFKLSQALVGPRANQYLDLAALSTICDMAPLQDENRILVKNGLEKISKSENRGVRALQDVAKIHAQKINTGHVGFMLGPRINAAGRMSSPDIALQLLLTDHPQEAASLAKVLDEENKLRQKEERSVVREAIQEVDRTVNFKNDRVIVVARQGWHPGVIGIVAARLVEKYHRPSLVIAYNDGLGQGSGRSIQGFHLFNALQACGACFEEYGGHEQAAGFSIRSDQIDRMRKAINAHSRATYEPEAFVKKVKWDIRIQLQELTAPFSQELELLEPHGVGHPKPVFLTDRLEIKKGPEKIGPLRYRFWITDSHFTYEANWKDGEDSGRQACLEPGVKLSLVYSIKTRLWNGRELVSLEVKDFTPQL